MSGFQGIRRPSLPRLVTTEERIERALAKLRERGVTNDFCPRCNTHDWNVDVLQIPANSGMSSGFGSAREAFSAALVGRTAGILQILGLVCKNCGYSIFHNLDVLGV